MDRNSFEDWVWLMRANIQASTIALMTNDMINRGLGAPDTEDMKSFSEEGAAVADLWQESVIDV